MCNKFDKFGMKGVSIVSLSHLSPRTIGRTDKVTGFLSLLYDRFVKFVGNS